MSIRHKAADFDAENRVAELFTKLGQGKWRVRQAVHFACYDLIVYPRESKIPVALVEVKSRNMASTDHPDVHVSLFKIQRCLGEVKKLGAAYLVFAAVLTDGVFVLRIDNKEQLANYATRVGGRWDRPERLKCDLETMVIFPMGSMKKIA